MRKISAALVAATLAAGFALVAQPAVAAETEEPEVEVCYADETHTELTWELQRSDWVAATPGSPATYGAVYDYSETRTTGHFEATADGLHIWTEGATSTDKVALYQSVDIPLLSVTSASVDYTATTGITPGSQLVVDIDGDGNGDGILVGEPVYGDVFWLSNSATPEFKALAPHVGGGYGSENYGTLAEWGLKATGANIVAIGFSLGSGVLGDGIVHSVIVGGVEFPFHEQTAAAVDPVPEHYTDWYLVEDGQSVELPDGREDGEEFQTDALYRYVVTGDVEVIEEVEVECPPPTEEPTPTPTPTETPKPSATAVPTSTNQLADTGFDGTSLLVLAFGGLVVGTIIVVTARVRARKQ